MAIYLKLDGIDGNVSDKYHSNWIELKTVDFGVERPTIMGFGKKENIDYGNMRFDQVLVTKAVDQATPLLYQACCASKVFERVILQVSNSDDKAAYLEYEMTNAIISSYRNAGFGTKSGETEFNDVLKIAYGKMIIKFINTDTTHKADRPVVAGYDLTTCQKV